MAKVKIKRMRSGSAAAVCKLLGSHVDTIRSVLLLPQKAPQKCFAASTESQKIMFDRMTLQICSANQKNMFVL